MLYKLLAERTHFFLCVIYSEQELYILSIQAFSYSLSFHWTINIRYSRWLVFFLCLIIPATCICELTSYTRLSIRSSTCHSGRYCHPVIYRKLTAFLTLSANSFETIKMWKITTPHSISPSKQVSGMECYILFRHTCTIYPVGTTGKISSSQLEAWLYKLVPFSHCVQTTMYALLVHTGPSPRIGNRAICTHHIT